MIGGHLAGGCHHGEAAMQSLRLLDQERPILRRIDKLDCGKEYGLKAEESFANRFADTVQTSLQVVEILVKPLL